MLGHHGNKANLMLGTFPVSQRQKSGFLQMPDTGSSFRCLTLVLPSDAGHWFFLQMPDTGPSFVLEIVFQYHIK